MKIGIYLGEFTPGDGGSYTYQSMVCQAIATLKCEHSFCVFYYGDTPPPYCDGMEAIQLIKPYIPNPCVEQMPECIFEQKEPLPVSFPIPTQSSSLRRIVGKQELSSTQSPMVYTTRLAQTVIRAKQALKDMTLNPPEPVYLTLAMAEAQFPVDIMWFLSPMYEPSLSPFIYTVWDLQHHVQPYFPEVSIGEWTWEQREALYQQTIPRATLVLTGNNRGKEELTTYYAIAEERIAIAPFPCPPFALEEYDQQTLDIEQPFLFYPAQFWPHKNHIVILLALKLLRDKHNIKLNIVFTGSDKGNTDYIQQKIEEYGLTDQIHCWGFVSQDILRSLYHQAFALVYPSYFGPNNLPPLEAFALGCPVVTADVPGSREQLGDACLYFNPSDEFELAQQILTLWQTPELRTQLVAKGHHHPAWTPQDYVRLVLDKLEPYVAIRRCWPMARDTMRNNASNAEDRYLDVR